MMRECIEANRDSKNARTRAQDICDNEPGTHKLFEPQPANDASHICNGMATRMPNTKVSKDDATIGIESTLHTQLVSILSLSLSLFIT